MKRTVIIFSLLIIIVVFTASGSMQLNSAADEPGPGEQAVTVYFPSSDLRGFNAPAVNSERRIVPASESPEELAMLVLGELIKGPGDGASRPVFQAGSAVKWVSLAIDWAGIGFTGGFLSAQAPDYTLLKYCVVLSLSESLSELVTLREVSLYVDDLLLKDDGEVSGILSPQDVVLGISDRPVSYRLTLYYPSDNYEQLLVRTRDVEIATSLRLEDYILQELMAPSDGGMAAVIPESVTLISYETEYGICTVDFSEQFRTALGRNQRRARAVIYSIVNSLCDIDTVQRVRITVEGESDIAIGGVDLGGYLTHQDALY